MCTVIVSVEPEADAPVLLAGVRDEFVTRPWMSPDRHWPAYPGLVGGRDLQAGGTWLAADPENRRVAALLNGDGVAASEGRRHSRGELPLLAAAAGEFPPLNLSWYDPFHLLLGGLDGVRLWSWDGRSLAEEKLPAGVHMIVNAGWDREESEPRTAWFRPRFARAARPGWTTGGSTERFWGEWLDPASGAGMPWDDPRALVMRRRLPDGRVFASLSITLVAVAEEGLRYDFCPQPDDPATWHEVDTSWGAPADRVRRRRG
ncbi:NRDE family protein [Microbispora sp. SCL1-1]|nr:NRDE family protein [Microbispora sp. CL1-1]NJP25087.1 NRDE family protein [Microbispora sp. CL1-1]TQS14001.1 NRDE family protein [Microbispora sp. SCL1-1]